MKSLKYVLPLLMLSFLACKKESTGSDYSYNNSDSLYISEVKRNGENFEKFYYDSLNRISKVETIYDDSIVNTESYSYYTEDGFQVTEYQSYGVKYKYYFNSGQKLIKMLQINPNTEEYLVTYEYNGNRIIKAKKMNRGSEISCFKYEYDSRGNTTLRKEGSSTGEDDFGVIYEQKYRYDEYKNPYFKSKVAPFDIIQLNNPTYSYVYAIYMSSFPTGVKMTYEYNSLGYPIEMTSTYEEYVDTLKLQYLYTVLE
jgi:hypothetical protein